MPHDLRVRGLLLATLLGVGVTALGNGAGPGPQAGNAPSASVAFTVVPGERFGPIRETTRRRELGALLQTTALEDMPIPIGEGFCTDGTRAFGGTANQIDIAWKTPELTGVAFVRASTPGGQWATMGGVRVGTLLTELERVAGHVLEFSGFGWDYGGGLSWTEGDRSIGLRLDADFADARLQPSEQDGIFGDRVVRSDHPTIRRLHVRVDEMSQSWGSHGREFDCR